MRVLSLFSGIGALDYGLQNAGMEIAGQCEIEEFPRCALQKHWPNVPKFKDVKTLTGEQITAQCGAIDLLAGGPPCQPSSTAGKRRGAADDRWLWPDFLRLVSEVRPLWVLAENPRAVLSLAVEGAQFRDWIAGEFERRGYELLPILLSAESVGAPHRRERVWFIAYSIDCAGELAQPSRVQSKRRRGVGNLDSAARETERDRAERERLRHAAFDCGSDVANTGSAVRRPPAERRFDDDDGADAGREEAAGRLELCSAELADATRISQRESHDAQCAKPRRRARQNARGRSDGAGDDLANTNRQRQRQSQRDEQEKRRRAGDCCEGVGHANAFGSKCARLPSGEASQFSFARIYGSNQRWPARPGERQHEWEEPRVCGTAALESALGGAVARTPRRLARWRNAALKGLGNAVVPACVEVIARAILETERR